MPAPTDPVTGADPDTGHDTPMFADELEAAAAAIIEAGLWPRPGELVQDFAERAARAALTAGYDVRAKYLHVRCDRALAAEKRAHATTMRLLNEAEAQS